MTDEEATAIYNDEVRERECLEYIEASALVERQIARDLYGDEHKHHAHEIMLASLLPAEVIFLNDHWWEKTWPEEARKTIAMCVNCSDVFAWACGDAEGIFRSEIPDLFDHWQHDKEWGPAVWCMKKRRQMPQKPVENAIRKGGMWDLDALGLALNTQDAEVQAMFAAVVKARAPAVPLEKTE